jgi:hypothetical protein
MLLAIRQKNDLTDEVQLVCHGAAIALESADEPSCVVESVSTITRAAMNCRRAGRSSRAVRESPL